MRPDSFHPEKNNVNMRLLINKVLSTGKSLLLLGGEAAWPVNFSDIGHEVLDDLRVRDILVLDNLGTRKANIPCGPRTRERISQRPAGWT